MDNPTDGTNQTGQKDKSNPGQDSDKKRTLVEDRNKAKIEREKENEITDAFSYFDRKRQGKVPISNLEDVVSMLGITLPPGDKRTPLIKLADPQSNMV